MAKKNMKELNEKELQAERNKKFLIELTGLAEKNNKINPELYDKYSVKIGLRNANGTGVLVGLTEIGDVHGYILDENEKKPVHGRLRYRNIDIKDLLERAKEQKRSSFEETIYLLLFGDLPTKTQLESFNNLLDEKRPLPEGFTEDMILKAPSSDIMNKLARGVLASYSYDQKPEDRSLKNIVRQCIELIARFPAIVAYGYQARAHHYLKKSLYIHHPIKRLSTAENFLHLMRPDGKYSKTEAMVLDYCLTLHAEHGGGNNSTFTTHVVTSADTDVYSAIAAAIGSLKGNKHGGANIKVVNMVQNIKANVKETSSEGQLKDYLTKIMTKKAYDKTGLIYGIGHAVYTLSDPRAILLKKQAQKLAKEKGRLEEFELYESIERLAPQVFQEVKQTDKIVAANVDLYSGLVYELLNLPKEVYTPLFAIGRIAGWSAHIIEERISGQKIFRPAYKNVYNERKQASSQADKK